MWIGYLTVPSLPQLFCVDVKHQFKQTKQILIRHNRCRNRTLPCPFFQSNKSLEMIRLHAGIQKIFSGEGDGVQLQTSNNVLPFHSQCPRKSRWGPIPQCPAPAGSEHALKRFKYPFINDDETNLATYFNNWTASCEI